jgi:hypothetical protein
MIYINYKAKIYLFQMFKYHSIFNSEPIKLLSIDTVL